MTLGLQRNPGGRNTRRGGFTLIELLVVVAILALLISIVLPSYSHVKQLAYATATQSFIRQLESGCEAYYQDYKQYPGQDAASINAMSTVATDWTGVYGGRFTGSQILAQRLFGFDTNKVRFAQPKEYAPFKQEYLDDASGTITGQPLTVMDRFTVPMPILYFPARAGMTGTNTYVWHDNESYLNSKSAQDIATPPPAWAAPGYADDFSNEIMDTRFTNVVRAYRPDSYIFIAAGMDRKYFTDDDTLNFNK